MHNMKTIKINYHGENYEIRLTRIKAFPYDVFKIDFDDNPILLKTMESPAYIVELPDKISFPNFQDLESHDLLMSFVWGIEQNYPID